MECGASWIQSWAAVAQALAAVAQAFAAVALVVLTLLSLFVLRGYADDTKRIADKSVEQSENAQMPFVALLSRTPHTAHDAGGWALENQGFGPALNIRYVHDAGWRLVTPLAKTDFYSLSGTTIHQDLAFTVEYESLSGTKYITTVDWPNAVMRTRFATALPH